MSEGRPKVGEKAFVQNAFIDWNHGYSNPPQLIVVIDEQLKTDEWLPLSGVEPFVEDNGFGLWRGWQEGLPVSEETGRGWEPDVVLHEDKGELAMYEMLDHVVKGHVNDSSEGSVLSVRFKKGFDGSPNTLTVSAETVQDIVDQFINGERRQPRDYWAVKNGDSPESPRHERQRVVLESDPVYTWYPEIQSEAEDPYQ